MVGRTSSLLLSDTRSDPRWSTAGCDGPRDERTASFRRGADLQRVDDAAHAFDGVGERGRTRPFLRRGDGTAQINGAVAAYHTHTRQIRVLRGHEARLHLRFNACVL